MSTRTREARHRNAHHRHAWLQAVLEGPRSSRQGYPACCLLEPGTDCFVRTPHARECGIYLQFGVRRCTSSSCMSHTLSSRNRQARQCHHAADADAAVELSLQVRTPTDQESGYRLGLTNARWYCLHHIPAQRPRWKSPYGPRCKLICEHLAEA